MDYPLITAAPSDCDERYFRDVWFIIKQVVNHDSDVKEKFNR